MLNILMQANSGAGAAAPGVFMQVAPFILVGFIFYFLLIRPQNRRLKEHKAMLSAVVRGDTVVTNGGLVGKVTKVSDDEVTVDLGGGTKVQVKKSMLADIPSRTAAPANDAGEPKKKK